MSPFLQFILAFVVLSYTVLFLSDPADRMNYTVAYEQTFDSAAVLEQFDFSSRENWGFAREGRETGALRFSGHSPYLPPPGTPALIGILSHRLFREFVLELDAILENEEGPAGDLCLIFNFQDPRHYYYLHLRDNDGHVAWSVVLVRDAAREVLASGTSRDRLWAPFQWHHIRIERSAEFGFIRVYLDGQREPLVLAEDYRYTNGAVGFGSFNGNTGMLDNLKVWKPDSGLY